MKPMGLLLAAGRGRRFDASGRQHKLLQILPDGRTVAEAAAANLLAAVPDVLALLPAGNDPHTERLQTLLTQAGCRVLACPQAELGMGHTLAAGVAATPAVAGWLIALADMPWIAPASIRDVVAAMADYDQIVQPSWQGQPGHPVGFPARYRTALLALQGDEGARRVMAGEAVVRFACEDGGVVRDVDTAADLTART